jgi:hypothetical protein
MMERPVPAADFELTPEDWEEVNLAHLLESPLYAEAKSNSRVIGGLLFATLAVFSALMGSTTGALMFAITGPPFVYFLGPLQRKAQSKSLKRLAKEGVSNGLFGHHRVEVREEGLFHSTHAYETLIRWHAVDDVREVDGYFFVYTGPNAFVPIPVTAFPDSESLRAFSDAFHACRARHREIGADSSRQPGQVIEGNG